MGLRAIALGLGKRRKGRLSFSCEAASERCRRKKKKGEVYQVKCEELHRKGGGQKYLEKKQTLVGGGGGSAKYRFFCSWLTWNLGGEGGRGIFMAEGGRKKRICYYSNSLKLRGVAQKRCMGGKKKGMENFSTCGLSSSLGGESSLKARIARALCGRRRTKIWKGERGILKVFLLLSYRWTRNTIPISYALNEGRRNVGEEKSHENSGEVTWRRRYVLRDLKNVKKERGKEGVTQRASGNFFSVKPNLEGAGGGNSASER